MSPAHERLHVSEGGVLLGQCLEDGVSLLCHCHQAELELRSSLNHAASLISDVFQGGGDVDFFGSLRHSIKDHVYKDVGTRPSHTVTAVDDHWAGTASVGFVNFPSEL